MVHPATIPLDFRRPHSVECEIPGCRNLVNNMDHGWYMCPLCMTRCCSLNCVREHITYGQHHSCSMAVPWICDGSSLIECDSLLSRIWVSAHRMVNQSWVMSPAGMYPITITDKIRRAAMKSAQHVGIRLSAIAGASNDDYRSALNENADIDHFENRQRDQIKRGEFCRYLAEEVREASATVPQDM